MTFRTGVEYAQAPSATERPQEMAPAAPVPWDASDTQGRISWAQAINLALVSWGMTDIKNEEAYFRNLERLANRFYSLIHKGPTAPMEETTAPARKV